MNLRRIAGLLVFFGLCLSSPTIKASFCSAKSLYKILIERVAFEKKLHKPFDSFYVTKGKKTCFKKFEFEDPIPANSIVYTPFILADISVAYKRIFFSSLSHSYHLQRGPPLS
jgi:hypothetical protein